MNNPAAIEVNIIHAIIISDLVNAEYINIPNKKPRSVINITLSIIL